MRLLACLLTMTLACQSLADDLIDDAVTRLQDYLRIDTVNPPGNESRGVEFLAGLLDSHGIPYDAVESAPGRGNIWARIEGGDEPALVLLHHIDVVPADADHWRVDPSRLKSTKITSMDGAR